MNTFIFEVPRNQETKVEEFLKHNKTDIPFKEIDFEWSKYRYATTTFYSICYKVRENG